MYIAETKAGKPVKAQGFHTQDWSFSATDRRPRKVVFVAENDGLTAQTFSDWQSAVNHVRKHLPTGYAVARYLEPARDEWLVWKVWYSPLYKGKHLRVTDPREFEVVMTTKPERHTAPADLLIAPSFKELDRLTCYTQDNPHHSLTCRPPAPTIAQSKPKPKAIIQQPGVGYYLATPSGNRITKWMFTTHSATVAYATQIGMEI
jgi:hypothetical protein